MKDRFTNVVETIAFLSIAVVALGALGKWHFLLDLASHLRIQAILALLVACPILLFRKRKRWTIASGACAILLTASLWSFWVRAPTTEPAEGTTTHRLIAINVLTSNQQHGLVTDYIKQQDPDFVVLQETDSKWIESLDAALASNWPYHKTVPRSDNFGMALYSKLPWETCEVVNFATGATPSIDARFKLSEGRKLQLIGVHPVPPMSGLLWRARNGVFLALAQSLIKSGAERTIVAGDLNCSPWSYWFRRLAREAGLTNSARGRGLNITWMPYRIGVLGLPIDHALIGSKIQVKQRSVGPWIGSDHRPVVLEFE